MQVLARLLPSVRPWPCPQEGWRPVAARVFCDCAGCWRRAKGVSGLYQGFSMGLGSSIAGAGVGFATYEALTVAYRKRVGYAPTPAERGAIAGVAYHKLQQGPKGCS